MKTPTKEFLAKLKASSLQDHQEWNRHSYKKKNILSDGYFRE